ncbi:major facilitator superfamily domain-containing protein [Umbelopsis sp. AD052]|nr:major facilitator superfamily domain-containing protein [Umbelopsis sp. AD052]
MVVYGIIVPIIPFIMLSIDMGKSPEDVDPYATTGDDGQVSQQTGVLLALFAAGILVGSPLFGYLGDKMKRRQGPMLIGILGLIASTLLFMFSRHYYELLIARFLQGIADSCVWILCLCLVAENFPKGELGLQMGKVMVFYSVGMTSGPPIGAPFIFCIILATIDFIMRLLIVERRHNPKEWFEDMDRAYEAKKKLSTSDEKSVAPTAVSTSPKAAIANKVSVLKLLSHTRMLGAIGLTFVSAMVLSSIELTLTLRLSDEWKYNTSQIGVVYLAEVLPGFVAGPLAGHLSDKFGAKIVILPALMVASAMCMVLGLPNQSTTIAPMIVILLLEGFFGSAVMSPIMSEIAAVVDLENKEDGESDGFARSFALFNMAMSGGTLVGPLMAGYVYSALGYFWLNVILGCIMALCIPIVWFWVGVKGKLIQRPSAATNPTKEPSLDEEPLSVPEEKQTVSTS